MRTMCGTILAALYAATAAAVDVKIDFDEVEGAIKPVHSTGQGPLSFGPDFSMFRYLKDAGVPYVA